CFQLPSIRSQFMKVYSFDWPPTSAGGKLRDGRRKTASRLPPKWKFNAFGGRPVPVCVPWGLDRQA
ncbi:MAG TPA: hypothetical protein VLA17_02045, partial [Candidatus Limnocylindria bacterium]|nr:hypothetical protein [Candidatus Limnocylindria bacterium]